MRPTLTAEDEQEALTVVQDMRRAVGSHRIKSATPDFRVTLSSGVLHIGAVLSEYDEVMRSVDTALYQARMKRRNQFKKIAA